MGNDTDLQTVTQLCENSTTIKTEQAGALISRATHYPVAQMATVVADETNVRSRVNGASAPQSLTKSTSADVHPRYGGAVTPRRN